MSTVDSWLSRWTVLSSSPSRRNQSAPDFQYCRLDGDGDDGDGDDDDDDDVATEEAANIANIGHLGPPTAVAPSSLANMSNSMTDAHGVTVGTTSGNVSNVTTGSNGNVTGFSVTNGVIGVTDGVEGYTVGVPFGTIATVTVNNGVISVSTLP